MSTYTRKYGYAFEAWRHRHAYTRTFGASHAPVKPAGAVLAQPSFDPALDLGARIDAGVTGKQVEARRAGENGF